jgi:acyl-CoA thioester hydrolase
MTDTAPLPLMLVNVKAEWLDFNGHMNDAAYGIAFSEAFLAMTDQLGLDEAGRAATGRTIYTLSMMTRYVQEAPPAAPLAVHGRVIEADDKRMRVWAEMLHAETGALLATNEQLLLCIDQSAEAPRAARWPEPFASRLAAMTKDHAGLALPKGAGEGVRMKRPA